MVKLKVSNLAKGSSISVTADDFVLIAQDPTGNLNDYYYLPDMVTYWDGDTDLSLPLPFGDAETLKLTLFYTVPKDTEVYAFVCSNVLNYEAAGSFFMYFYYDDNVIAEESIHDTVYDTAGTRITDGDMTFFYLNEWIEPENGVAFKINDVTYQERADEKIQVLVNLSVALTSSSEALWVADYNFLLFCDAFYLPETISIAGGEFQKVESTILNLYDTTPTEVTLAYLVPADTETRFLIQTNMFDKEPAGDVYIADLS
jgi:hypothetical protein